MEVFQGQESRVIVLTTVRSVAESPLDARGADAKATAEARRHVGFLANPRRFNTAVTRAMELLIVVGNVAVLEADVCWGALVRWCRARGAVL